MSVEKRLFLRLKFKDKQKIRKFPADFKALAQCAVSIGAEEDFVYVTSDRDLIENDEDFEVVKAFAETSAQNVFELMIITEGEYRDLISTPTPKIEIESKSDPAPLFPPQQHNPYSDIIFPQSQEFSFQAYGPGPSIIFPPGTPANAEPLFPKISAAQAGNKRKQGCHIIEGGPRKKLMSVDPRKRRKEAKEREQKEIMKKLRDERTAPFQGSYTETEPRDGGLWACQICLVCLATVQYCNLNDHLNGNRHLNAFAKDPRKPIFPRVPPIMISEEEAATHQEWVNEQKNPIVYICAKNRFRELCCYQDGYRVLVIGEQDFSYTLAVANYGCEVIGTSYMDAHNPDIPDPNPSKLDDAAREVYDQKTLSSMGGELHSNVELAKQKGIDVRYKVDAKDLQTTLIDKGVEGNFDIIVFPFPRATLFRGCDPKNSLLIREFFGSVKRSGVLTSGGIVQLVMLESQFNEWDIYQVSKEAGFKLEYCVEMNYPEFRPYRSRDLLGKKFDPKNARLLVFKSQDEGDDLDFAVSPGDF